MVGVGMSVSELTKRLGTSASVLVLDGGHPVGVLTRSDLLGFLEQRSVEVSGFNTRAIHVGSEPDPVTGAVNPPVYLTSTYAQDGVGVPRFSDYARGRQSHAGGAGSVSCADSRRPVRRRLCFRSRRRGRAASHALLPGDHVIIGDDAYGGTYRLLDQSLRHWGVSISTVDLEDLDAVGAGDD